MAERAMVQAGRLNVEVDFGGPETGAPVLMLHGWPDSAATYDAIRPALHRNGFRTICPSLCGYSGAIVQGGAADAAPEDLAQDALDLISALGLNRAAVVGHDWGARAAYAAAVLAPERISACVTLSVGYDGVGGPNVQLSPGHAQNFWYQWWFATKHGEAALRGDPAPMVRHIWQLWAAGPTGRAVDNAIAAAGNAGWADATLSYYRVRWGEAPPSALAAAARARIAQAPTIPVPTLFLQGGADPCTPPALSAGKEHHFRGGYARHVLDGVGHFPQLEAPDAVAGHILPFLAAQASLR